MEKTGEILNNQEACCQVFVIWKKAYSGNGDSKCEEREFSIFNHVIPICLTEKAALQEDMGLTIEGKNISGELIASARSLGW